MTTSTTPLAGMRLEGTPQSPERAAFMHLLNEHEELECALLYRTGILEISDSMIERAAEQLWNAAGRTPWVHLDPSVPAYQAILDEWRARARRVLEATLLNDRLGGELAEQFRMSRRKVVAAFDHASLTKGHP